MPSLKFACCIAFTLVLLSCCPLLAQFTTGSLGGAAMDVSGAAVVDAKITVRNIRTGFVQTVATGSDGAFLFSRLPVGDYELRAEKEGFATYLQSGITLAVDKAASITVTLQVGQVSTQVTVSGESELVSTRTSAGGQLVGLVPIVELPLNGRRPERLMYLAAGTVDLARDHCLVCTNGGIYPGEESASVNGSIQGQVNFQMDATDHNDTYMNASLPFPNPDAIQEFSLLSSNFTAEYGNAGGGIVNIITRSGTNEFHGSAFEFVRNGDLNARQFFAPDQDKLKRNQFGGSLGGPIVKNRLFFFGTYQGTRVRNLPAGIVQFVPTAAQSNGDFSGSPQKLIDPLSRQPLANNQIPASRIDPAAKYFLNYIPLPNGPNGQLTFPGTRIVQGENQFMNKVDYVVGRHQISGRYFFTDFSAPPDISKTNILAASSAGNQVRVQNISFNYTFTVSPTLLINSTFGLNRQRGGTLSSAPFSYADAGIKILGPQDTPLKAPPEMGITVTGGFSFTTNHLGQFDRGDFTIREVVTKIRGGHELRFGGEAVRVSNHLVNTANMSGGWQFNGQLAGLGLADFMFGDASQFKQGGGEFKDFKGTRWGFFLQDNWRVSHRLTLNLGMRWDPYIPPYDRQGRVVCFAGQAASISKRYPNAPRGFLYGGDPGCPQAGSNPNWMNLGPRFGFAYRLTNDGKTSLRGGAGFYYTPTQTNSFNAFADTAPFSGVFIYNAVSFSDPYGSLGLANPFPANFGPHVPGSDFVFAPNNVIPSYFPPDYRIPQLITWNLRLERQVGKDWVVSAAYLGNKGSYLGIGMQENPAVYLPGVDAKGNPISTVGNTQQRRVYPIDGAITRVESGGNSNYNALQLNAEKRFARGFSVLTNYTWSKTLDTLSGIDPLTRRFERGISNNSIPQNFKFSGIYQVPRFHLSGGADRLLNGWEANAIMIWQSGLPFTVTSGRDNSFTGIGSDRADVVGAGSAQLGDGRPRGQEIMKWFDTSKFTYNAVGTFGNAARNVLRAPRFFNTDFGLAKSTKVTERANLQFRAEFFNLFNNVDFQYPNSNVSSAQFGQITSVIDSSQRILQFGLKLLF